MRSCTVEIDKVIGTEWPPVSVSQGGSYSLASIYRAAGMNLRVNTNQSNIPAPETGDAFDLAILHHYMVKYRRRDIAGWRAHMLIVPKIEYLSGIFIRKPLGIMYDFRDNDINSIPREGSAVAHDYVSSNPLIYMRSLAHELGHVFNLLHPKDEIPPQPMGTSLMNQTLDLQALGDFPNNISFTFSESNIRWLKQAPAEFVQPGGKPFGDRPEEESDLVADVAYPITPGLHFTVSTRQDSYMVGEPIMLRLSLRCIGDSPITVVSDLSCYTGVVNISIITPTNRRVHFRPCYYAELEPSTFALLPSSEILNNVPIFFGSSGHLFSSSGIYKIAASYRANVAGTQICAVSKIHQVEIRSPSSEADFELSDLLMQPPQALFMILRGGAHLQTAVENLKIAVKRFGSHSAAQMAKLSLASHLVTEGKEKSDISKAEELLTAIPDSQLDYEQRAERSALLAKVNQAVGNATGVEKNLSDFKEVATRCFPEVAPHVDDLKIRVKRFRK